MNDDWYEVDHVIELPPERMIWRGMDEHGNPIMDVLQPDGTYKTCRTETIEQYRIEGPVALHFSPDGEVSIETGEDDDES